MHEDARGVVLCEQGFHDFRRQLFCVVLGQINEIIAAVDPNNHVGFGGILPEDRAGAARMLACLVIDSGAVGGWLMHWQAKGLGEIDCEEPRWNVSFGNLVVVDLSGRTGLALLRYRTEAVVGGNEYVRVRVEPELLECIHNGCEIVVRDLDRREGGRTIDARRELTDTITLRMLRAVWIGRPVEQHERLALFLVIRQQHSGDDVTIVFLLDYVGPFAWIVALRTPRSLQRQPSLLKLLDHFWAQFDAILLTGIIVEEDRCLTIELRQIMDANRSDLSERGREIALLACCLHDRAFCNEIATMMR